MDNQMMNTMKDASLLAVYYSELSKKDAVDFLKSPAIKILETDMNSLFDYESQVIYFFANSFNQALFKVFEKFNLVTSDMIDELVSYFSIDVEPIYISQHDTTFIFFQSVFKEVLSEEFRKMYDTGLTIIPEVWLKSNQKEIIAKVYHKIADKISLGEINARIVN